MKDYKEVQFNNQSFIFSMTVEDQHEMSELVNDLESLGAEYRVLTYVNGRCDEIVWSPAAKAKVVQSHQNWLESIVE